MGLGVFASWSPCDKRRYHAVRKFGLEVEALVKTIGSSSVLKPWHEHRASCLMPARRSSLEQQECRGKLTSLKLLSCKT